MILQFVRRVPQYLATRLKSTSRVQSGIDVLDPRLEKIRDELIRSGYGRGIKVIAIPTEDCYLKAMIANEVTERGIKSLVASALSIAPGKVHIRVVCIEHFRTVNFYVGIPDGINEPILMLKGI